MPCSPVEKGFRDGFAYEVGLLVASVLIPEIALSA